MIHKPYLCVIAREALPVQGLAVRVAGEITPALTQIRDTKTISVTSKRVFTLYFTNSMQYGTDLPIKHHSIRKVKAAVFSELLDAPPREGLHRLVANMHLSCAFAQKTVHILEEQCE